MLRTAGRDRAAFRELYQATSAKLLGLLLRMVRDRSRAEDILQDVFTRVWEQGASFDPARGNVMAWLTIMARSRALDDLRRRARLVSADGLLEDMPADTIDPLQARADAEDHRQLTQCLDGLEPAKKEMVVLAYQHGLSRDELATRYKTPVATIKTWLRRALENLRNCLSTHVG
jgi:RNA polymerase sigma-70 factor (ECF subfamily)